jgi:hypothetical protein
MVDHVPVGRDDLAGKIGVVETSVHDHVTAQPCQLARQRCDVDVLAAGVDTAQRGQRAGVFGHQCHR